MKREVKTGFPQMVGKDDVPLLLHFVCYNKKIENFVESIVVEGDLR